MTNVGKFLLWCILLVLCWPLALLAVVVYPIVWILLIPFRLAGIAVQGVLGLLRGLVTFPARLLNGPRAENTAAVKAGNLLLLLNDDAELIVAKASRSGFDPICALHRCRQRHVGTTHHLGQSHLHQGCHLAVAVDNRLKPSLN